MPLITGKTGLSPSLLNQIGLFVGTGSDIAGLGTGSNVKLAYCTTSGSGFIAEHYYFRKQDNSWQVLNLTKHYHDQDDDDSGGLYSQIRYNNRHQYYAVELQGSFTGQVFQEISGSGGASVNVPSGDYVTLSTGTTVTNYANIKTGGRRHEWDLPSRFDIKCRTNASTQLVARAGVNMESLIGGNDVISKYGMEFCDSTGANWQVVSASGSVRSIQASSAVGATGTAIMYRLEHTPGGAGVGQVKFTVGFGASPFTVKTSDPPHSAGGADYSQPANTVTAGIKTSDTNNKEFYIWGMWFEGIPASIDASL